MDFYCVKGRHKVSVSNFTKVKVGKRNAVKAKCPKHGTTMFRFTA